MKASAVAIKAPVKKNVEKFYFKTRLNGKENNYGLVHLPSHLQLVTSVAKGAIKKGLQIQ